MLSNYAKTSIMPYDEKKALASEGLPSLIVLLCLLLLVEEINLGHCFSIPVAFTEIS